jgi:hypothetical protein
MYVDSFLRQIGFTFLASLIGILLSLQLLAKESLMRENKKNHIQAQKIVQEIRCCFPSINKDICGFFSSSLGYTLIGEKPVSYEEYVSNEEIVLSLNKFFSNSDEFIFSSIPCGCKRFEVCFIHKQSFLELCHNDELCREFLGKKGLTPKRFLREFVKSGESFEEFCTNNSSVIGTFLGFGSNNARLWSRWTRLGYFLGAWPFKQPSPMPSPLLLYSDLPTVSVPELMSSPKIHGDFRTLYSEWNWLNKGKRSFDTMPPPFIIPLPSFFYWEGNEDELKRYIRTREALGDILYEQGH